ncbi:hypothetical protein K445DRAFT_8538 [Daldinia sp. EC12]|nr:hypothetical protein K445DRAFT_8538 [Daldinia sp. EC12]
MDFSILPFYYFPSCRVVICTRCQYACLSSEVDAHLRRPEHANIIRARRIEIVRAVQAIPEIRRTQDDLLHFPYPPPTSPAIRQLPPPANDGLGCQKCSYVVRANSMIRAHYRKQHGWVNDRKSGRLRKGIAAPPRPWRTGVRCQRLFTHRRASQWFEVERDVAVSQVSLATRRTVPSPQVARSTTPSEDESFASVVPATQVGGSSLSAADQARSFAIVQKGVRDLERAHLLISRAPDLADEKMAPNPWVNRTGWAKHLKNHLSPNHLDRLLAAIGPVREDEPVMQVIWDSFVRVVDAARAHLHDLYAGSHFLFLLNYDGKGRPKEPFHVNLQEPTWKRYVGWVGQIVLYLQRTRTWDDEDRPPYVLTPAQEDFSRGLDELAQEGAKCGVTDELARALDRECLDLWIALLDHALPRSEYHSVLLSALAVMGVRPDYGWVEPANYTQRFAAVLKIARALVYSHSVIEREEQVCRYVDEGQTREKAEASSREVLEILQLKITTFMTQPFSNGHLRGLLFLSPHEETGEREGFLAILWGQLKDNPSESRLGHSFVRDADAQWPLNGQTALLSRVTTDAALKKA